MVTKNSDRTPLGTTKESVGFLFLVAIWFGLLTGWVEVAILTAEKLYFSPILRLSRDFVWMAPLAELTFLFLPGLFFFVISRLWPRFDPLPFTIFVCALLAFLNLLMLVPRFHHYAALVLAAGLAVQASRLIKVHTVAFHALVRRTTFGMIVLIVVLGLGVQGLRMLAERQALAELPPAPPNAPNVLFITLDTVRSANMSLYNYHRSTTPQLEHFAKTGLIFDRALSTAPWTLPSHASLFTGRLPHELSADWQIPLDATYPTLAEFLSARGYLTAGFVANTGYCSYETGLDRGFVHYEDYRISLGQIVASSTLVRTIADNFRLRRLIRNDEHLNRQSADQINGNVLRWLSSKRQRPFFIFLNYYDAHEPYLPPSPFDKKFGPGRKYWKYSPLHRWNWEPAVEHQNMTEENIHEEIDAYDGAIAYIDYHLGLLFDELRKRELIQNTLIIITADHGEEFGEHGVFDHGNSLYLPSLHVPLLISFPQHVPAGIRIQEPISLRDLPATVVDLLDFQDGFPFPGKSLARYWKGMLNLDSLQEKALLSEVNYTPGHPSWFPVSKGDMKSLVFGGRRYIKNGDGKEELYDFNHDPWEKQNLAGLDKSQPELKRFRALLEMVLERNSSSYKDTK